MEVDIFGKALMDYQTGQSAPDIITYSSLEEEDRIPVSYLFRDYSKMPRLEQQALNQCRGEILDIGCGAGSHSLYLQNKGFNVSSLDASAGAIETCKLRGIKNTVLSNLYDYQSKKFDTILLLMNGIGLAKNLANIDHFLHHLKSLLKPKGQILLDSTDIIYMYETDNDGGYWMPQDVDYYGDTLFSLAYKDLRSSVFPWLYLDFNTLQRASQANGLLCSLVSTGDHYDYLAKLYCSTY